MSLTDDFYDKYRESLIKTMGSKRLKEVKEVEEDLKAAQKKLITLNENDSEYDDTVNEIYRLRDEKHQILLNDAEQEEAVRQADKLMDFIKTLPTGITEYDDALVRKLIEKILITDKDIKVVFKMGYDVTVEA